MVDRQSLPPLTLTPNPTTPDNPPGEKLEALPPTPPSGTSRRAQGNPFRIDIPQSVKEANKHGYSEAVSKANVTSFALSWCCMLTCTYIPLLCVPLAHFFLHTRLTSAVAVISILSSY